MYRIRPMQERFWEKVDTSGECWEWTGARTKAGYGNLSLPRGAGNINAHRYSFLLHYGPFHKSLIVCHSCDNRGCVNPAHLWLGTDHDNAKDKMRKGRWVDTQGVKTSCPAGHPYSAENTYRAPGANNRHCRTCKASADKRAKAKKRTQTP